VEFLFLDQRMPFQKIHNRIAHMDYRKHSSKKGKESLTFNLTFKSV